MDESKKSTVREKSRRSKKKSSEGQEENLEKFKRSRVNNRKYFSNTLGTETIHRKIPYIGQTINPGNPKTNAVQRTKESYNII